MSLMVNNKYIDMSGISWRFTQGEKNSDTYEIRAPRYDESGTDLLALSWSMIGSHADYYTLIASAVSVSEDKANGSVVFAWKVSSDFTACDGVLDLCLQGSDGSGNVVIKYRSSGVHVAPTLSGNLNAPQNVIEQVLSQIALTLPQCAAAVEAAKTATEKADTAVIASNTATQKATGATASEKAAATSATAAKASETTAAQKATAAAASATAAANSSTIATTKAAEATASATAAQGYKVQTQQLRDEVHTIVAGNEAYTKQETHDKFSRALEVESPTAAAQVIAVEPQSDLRARYYGFTEQAGADVVSGVNLCPPLSKLVSGVTYSAGTDCTSTANGTATGWAAADIRLPPSLYQLFGDCTVSIKISGVSNFVRGAGLIASWKDGVRNSVVEAIFTSTSESTISKTGTIASSYDELQIGFTFPVGTVFTNAKIYVMVEKGTIASQWTQYIEHTGAPSPTNIRPITVGGNVANLIPFPYADGMSKTTNGVTFTVQPDGGIKAVGTAVNNAVFNLIGSISDLKGKFLSGTVNSNIISVRGVYTDDTYFADLGTGAAITKTVKSIYVVVLNGTTVNTTIYPMLNAGNSAYPYTPYTGYEYAGLMTAQGSNLFKTTILGQTKNGITLTINSDKSITFAGTATGSPWFNLFENEKFPNFKNLWISGTNNILFVRSYLYAVRKDGTYVTREVTRNEGTSVTNDNFLSMTYSINISLGTTVNATIYPMLNAGTTALPYEPYIPPTNYVLPSPVALPDGCSVKAGYVDADKMIVFDGTEKWEGYLYGNYFVAATTPEVKTNTNNQKIFSNLFHQSITSGVFTNSVGQIAVNISKDIASTVEQFKARLAELNAKGTPWTAYYQSTSYAGEKIPVWLVNVTKKKVVLTGTEKYSKGGHVGTLGFYVFVVTSIYNVGNENNDEICSHFKNAKVDLSSENADFIVDAFCTNIGSSPRFIISHGKLGTTSASTIEQCFTAAVKYIKEQYDSGTPITLTSKLATPETYAIPYTRCESPDTVNCTISTPEGTCSALYNADLRTYIDRLQSAIIALGGTI